MLSTMVNQQLGQVAEQLVGSEIIKIAGKINNMIAEGQDVVNLTIGDFNPKYFQIPSFLKAEIIAAYQDDQTNYPPANGLEELRSAISRFLHTRQGLEYESSEIIVAGGSRPLIYAIYSTILDKGDTVIYPTPSWNNNHYTHLHEGKQLPIPSGVHTKFLPTAGAIEKYISEASMISLCSPLNPSGTLFSDRRLEEICHVIVAENKKRGFKKKPVYLLYDQVYWLMTYGQAFHHDPVNLVPEMKDYTIYVDGISKSFAATGVRVGWSFGPEKVINKMRAILGHIGAWAPRPEQQGVARFLLQDDIVDGFLEMHKNKVYDRLKSFHNGFMEMKENGLPVDAVVPEAAIYLSVSFEVLGKRTPAGDLIESALDIVSYFLDEAKVGMVPFQFFDADKSMISWFRISVGNVSMEQIPHVISAMKEAIMKLN